MLIALAFVLSLAWMLGLGFFHVTSAAIHVLVVLASGARSVFMLGLRTGGWPVVRSNA